MSAPPILVVGSVALDDIRTPFGEVSEAFGGSAAYFSLAARVFAPVRMVAVVGNDLPAEHLDDLQAQGVDTRGVEVADGLTFRWGGEYGYDLNARKTLFTHLNVFESFHPSVPAAFRRSPYVFLGNIHPALQAEVLEQVEDPVLVALDTMNLWIETARSELLQVLGSVDLLILNDSEARELAGEPNLVRAGRGLLELGPSCVVIKKGEHGALMLGESSMFCSPAVPLEQVCDPTGAGDAFAGGLVGHLAASGDLSDDAMRRAIAYGTVLASYTVEDFGVAGLRDVERADIEKRYRELRLLTQFGVEDPVQKTHA
ncbi:MAG: bifunctional hydroxymethylpyrimidine kinase/phosphomethylpyrimidine kinase [Candidatus Latescibacterota bacterium]|nr:MAG: bifunctional hydroxymethylpyrimidine kinase/phosphomethylpyrimidine kinase [Candidatus Latescibacterota bacterium]